MQYPKQSKTVHVENLNGEVCLYDWRRLKVHNLNPTAARVWELCDGQTTPQQMAAQLHGNLTPAQAEEVVWLTLKRLEQAHLLEDKVEQPAGHRVYTRRELLTRLGVAAIMLPVISTIAAPSPVAAQSQVSGAACPIVRTTAAIASPGNPTIFYPFTNGPITDAQIAACAPTTLTCAWTGPSPTVMTGVLLAQNASNPPTWMTIFPGDISPRISHSSSDWTGFRPYTGIRIQSFTPWNAGVITMTLS
jgi:hypothetical protein